MNFRTILELSGKTSTGLAVPEEIVLALGAGKRPPVRVTINGYSYRTTIAPMGGRYLLPVSAANRAGAGIAAGDEVEVGLEHDSAPREVSVPPDFAAALDGEPEARRFFEGLSYSNKLRLVLAIEGAKAAETRQRRIATTVDNLKDGRA